jgi:hypothetical protein
LVSSILRFCQVFATSGQHLGDAPFGVGLALPGFEDASGDVAPMVLRHVDVDHRLVDPLVAYDQVLAVIGGSANNDDYIDVSGAADNTWTEAEGDGPSGSVLAENASTTAIAQSTWVCVELDVMLATTGSALVLYVADQQVVTAPLVMPSPGYSSLSVGLAAVPGNGGTVYVDVVMAPQHIGCQ